MLKSTPVKIAGLVVLFLVGAAAGVAVGLPSMVERAGSQALTRVEDRLGVAISAESVDWSWDGTVTATGLVVRARSAEEGAPPLLAADRVTIDSDVRWFARRVRLRKVGLDGAVVHVLRDSSGALAAQDVVDRARAMFGGGSGDGGAKGQGGGLGYLDRALPELTLTGARVVVDRPPIALPAGLEIPARTLWSGGDVHVRPGADGERIDVEGRFDKTSLDTDNAVSFRVGVDFGEGRIVAPEVTFERPVRFYLGARVVGVRGAKWTPDEGVLTGLQLSVPLSADRQQATVGAAATVERIAFGPEPLTLLARAVASGQGVSPASVWRALDWVVVDGPVVMAAIDRSGHHSFEDLVGPLRFGGAFGGLAAVDEDAAPSPRSLTTEAVLAASVRLVSGEVRRRPKRGLRDVVSAAFVGLEARVGAVLGGLIDTVAGVDGPRVEIHEGKLTARVDGSTVSLTGVEAAVEREEGGNVVISGSFALPGSADGRATVKLTSNPVDRQLALVVEGVSLPLGVIASALPSSVVVGPNARLRDASLSLHWRDRSKVLTMSGAFGATEVGLSHRDLSSRPVVAEAGALKFDAVLDGRDDTFALSDGRLTVGEMAMDVALSVRAYAHAPRLSLTLSLPETPVQAVIDAIPEGLRPSLVGLEATGTLRWPLKVEIDTIDIPGMTIESDPELLGFYVRSMGQTVDLGQLETAVTYDILRADGTPGKRRAGPFASNWVPLADISPFMVKAVTTTEDAFYKHDGISTSAIRESIVANLEQMRFARGASTITQQLVKNLFLGGRKTIARKLQEVFIAWRMEQVSSKDAIMAWYLNVIEFGPGLYGIGDAAWHYFGKEAADLTALEAVFLASVIPNPLWYHQFFVDGAVSPGWRNYLRVLLNVMVERGKILREEADAAFPYDPIFRGSERATSDELRPFPEVYRVEPTVDDPDAPDDGMPWGIPVEDGGDGVHPDD